MKPLCHIVFVVMIGVSAAVMAAPSDADGAPAKRPIPFKQDPVSLETQSWQVGVTLLVLLAAAAGALYLVRKRVPGAIRRPEQVDRVQIVDRLRLDGRTQVYVLKFRTNEVLLAQSGEQLLQLHLSVPNTAEAAPASHEENPDD